MKRKTIRTWNIVHLCVIGVAILLNEFDPYLLVGSLIYAVAPTLTIIYLTNKEK
jgi:hypothetical protein